MEGGNPHATRAATDKALQTLAHFSSGLIGKRDGHNLPRGNVQIFHQMGNAMGKYAGFTGTGTRQNQQRAFRAQHRFALRAIQGIKIDGHAIRPNTTNRTGFKACAALTLYFGLLFYRAKRQCPTLSAVSLRFVRMGLTPAMGANNRRHDITHYEN